MKELNSVEKLHFSIFFRTMYEFGYGPNMLRKFVKSRKDAIEKCLKSRRDYTFPNGSESIYFNMTIWPSDIDMSFVLPKERLVFICRVINSKIFNPSYVGSDIITWFGEVALDPMRERDSGRFVTKYGNCILSAMKKLRQQEVYVDDDKFEEALRIYNSDKDIFERDTFIVL